RQRFVRDVRPDPTRAGKLLLAPELVEADSRKNQVAAVIALVERMQAQRAITLVARMPRQRRQLGAGERVIGVPAVEAERVIAQSAQRREFGADGIGAPAPNAEPA